MGGGNRWAGPEGNSGKLQRARNDRAARPSNGRSLRNGWLFRFVVVHQFNPRRRKMFNTEAKAVHCKEIREPSSQTLRERDEGASLRDACSTGDRSNAQMKNPGRLRPGLLVGETNSWKREDYSLSFRTFVSCSFSLASSRSSLCS
jgi:hypothetical protein